MMRYLSFVLAAALLGCLPATALEPTCVKNHTIYHLSSDGNWAAAEDFYQGTVSAINLVTGEVHTQEIERDGEELHVGVGNCISNRGTMVYSREYACSNAHYIEGGAHRVLPMPADYTCAWANGISADDRYIIGAGGYHMYNSEMGTAHAVFPLLWTKQPDGSYGMPQALDYPLKDIEGFMPQTILADFISDDGRTVAGQVVSGSGMFLQNILWRLGDDQKWSYEIIGEELYHPEGIDNPGPVPSGHFPMPADYILDEERRQEYIAALAYYEEDWLNNPYPDAEDYMTPEEYAAWEADANGYYEGSPSQYDLDNEELTQWAEKYAVWEAAVPTFAQNAICMSANGRYVSSASLKVGAAKTSCTTYVFDNELNSHVVKTVSGKTVFPDAVSNEGTVVAHNMAFLNNMPTQEVFISEDEDQGFTLLQDYMQARYPTTYEWMKTQMVRDFTTVIFDEDEGEDVERTYRDVWFIGQPRINSDGTLITTWIENGWDLESDDYFFSYVMPLDGFTGIGNVPADDTLSLSIDRHGLITISGEARTLRVYDINGRLVLSVANPGARVKTNLPSGAYILKAENAAAQAVAKAAL
ncbi:MAG: T9SS type A sorting domain-containing protein [Muribaculaceae bacterium]|nr:T9SS type A sorting domain-containing protein [Muribaculaceae bacterium]